MCQFKSAICLKNHVYVPDHDHHQSMISELGIDDNYIHATKTFVRVELIPPDGDKTSDPMGWELVVDQEEAMRPDWFSPEADEQRIKQAVREWWEKHVLTEGEHEVKDGVWYACDSATVKASDSATVYACNSATVYAYNSATVYVSDSATVKAYNSATVYACDSATVCACNSATVYAYDSATVYAYDSATVYACNSATVNAYGSATVKAYDSATVYVSDSATVYAYNSATVNACDSATVKASDSATVYACNSATVYAYNSATVYAYGRATVYASGSAAVILPEERQTEKPVSVSDNAICINYKTHTIKCAGKWTMEAT